MYWVLFGIKLSLFQGFKFQYESMCICLEMLVRVNVTTVACHSGTTATENVRFLLLGNSALLLLDREYKNARSQDLYISVSKI